jgi:DNA-binding CsgD family transcriptional regulator
VGDFRVNNNKSEILKILTEEEKKIYLLKLKNFSDEEIKKKLDKKHENYKSQKRSMQKKIDSINAEYKVVKYNEIQNLSKADFVKKIIKIDTTTGVITEEEKDIEFWLSLNFGSEDTRILLFGKEIVGYWHFLILRDDAFEKAKSGRLIDKELTINDLSYPVLPSDNHHLYFLCFTILEKHRNHKTFKMMLYTFIKQIEIYAEDDIYFTDIIANAYTLLGESLCNTLNMEFLNNHIECGKIYYNNLINISDIKCIEDAAPNLIKKYKEKGIIKKEEDAQ